MTKWFEHEQKSNVISSRIRLARNWEEYSFPSKLSQDDSNEMILRIEEKLKTISSDLEKNYQYFKLNTADELEKRALKERKVINSSIVEKKDPAGIFISDSESESIVINGDDHFRIQVLSRGLNLENNWKQADLIDDYLNRKFNYAFDQKYGYLTTYPTNVGTGLRASTVIHLPGISVSKKFSSLLADIGRIGVSIKGIYGEGKENYGAFYEVSNQKTLGITEKEIIDVVNKATIQLNTQENQIRELMKKDRKLERLDDTFKSYGVLKYAKRLSMKEALTLLSQLMSAYTDELIEWKEECSLYGLMIGIQPASLLLRSEAPLDKRELEIARADYLRNNLPEIFEL